MTSWILKGVVLTTWGGELRVDALSALMVVTISGIGLLTSVYSVRYLEERRTADTAAQPHSDVLWPADVVSRHHAVGMPYQQRDHVVRRH